MKRMRKFVSVVLAMMMVLGMGLTALAAENNPHATAKHTITITDTSHDGYEYEVYQVFKGEISTTDGKKTLSNIEWGSGVNGEALLNALREEASFGDVFTAKEEVDGEEVYKVRTASDVAAALAKFTDDKMIDKFSEIVGKNTANVAATEWKKVGSGADKDEAPWTYSVEVTGDGYYFVKNSKVPAGVTNPDGSVEGYSYTRYILQVVGDVSVAAKADAPEADKNIVSTEPVCGITDHEHVASCYKTKFNNGAIGDTVNFVIDSKVPNMDGYVKYFFVMKDTLPQGLTFTDGFDVKVGDVLLTESASPATDEENATKRENSYYVKYFDKDGNAWSGVNKAEIRSFEIVFENFIQYKEQTGTAIEIAYSVEINSSVNVGTTGEKNTLKLIYSNNPNEDAEPTPDEPDYPNPEKPVGETPNSETITYVTGLQLQKIDENGNPLSGAEFTITASVLNKFLVNKTEYVEDSTGEYYLLKDKTYTTTAPVFDEDPIKDTSKYYDNVQNGTVTKMYKLVSFEETVEQTPVDNEKTYTGYVDANGLLNLKGLAAGTYVIKEVKAPNGYNLLKDEITIEIDWTKPATGSEQCVWKVTKDGEELNLGTGEDNATLFVFQVENKSGALLPSTGGIGTTIFYVTGSILVLAAVVLLVTKKRMVREK